MNKLIIINDSDKYEINKAQDLYDLYNDWSIDYRLDTTKMTIKEYQTVVAIRDDYSSVFKEIEKKEYELLEFEVIALEIIGGKLNEIRNN